MGKKLTKADMALLEAAGQDDRREEIANIGYDGGSDSEYGAEVALATGASPNAKTDDGFTALHFASARKYGTLAHRLIEKGAYVNARDKDGQTPLHVAAQVGGNEVIRRLVEDGADITAKDKNGWTPLALVKKRLVECENDPDPWKKEGLKETVELLEKAKEAREKAVGKISPEEYAKTMPKVTGNEPIKFQDPQRQTVGGGVGSKDLER